MAIISAVENIFQEVERMVRRFETLVDKAVGTLETVASNVAGDIKNTSEEIFTGFRSRASKAIQAFKTRLEGKSFHTGGPGGAISGFKNRVESMLRVLAEDMQSLFDRFKNAMETILRDVEAALKDVSSKLTPLTKDITSAVETTAKDFLSALKTVGRNVESALARGEHFLSHEITVCSDFVHKHDAQFAETASVGLVGFGPIALLTGAGGLFYLGTMYEPKGGTF